jgi:resuscitation-promoting factor RpfC
MFSIPAAGVAKALLAVAIPLHPAAAHQAHQVPAHYTVRSGDTLSSIARHEYGRAADWPALWWVNRHKVHNPEAIAVGQRLKLTSWHPRKGWLDRAAMAAIPVAPAPAPAEAAPAAASAADPQPASTAAYAGAPGSFQSCVIQAESGGDPAAVNASSGAGGLYGFLPSTWQALGHSGLPENASVAEQNQAFQQEYAQSGTSAWSAYDGC